jgi:hypothetical protein
MTYRYVEAQLLILVCQLHALVALTLMKQIPVCKAIDLHLDHHHHHHHHNEL